MNTNRTIFTVIHRFGFFQAKVCYNGAEVASYLATRKPSSTGSFIIVKSDEQGNDRFVKVGNDYSDIIERCETT